MRAAEAAKNTSDLIEGTVQKVNTGAKLVAETSESFNAASQATERIGILITEISSSSGEQAKAIGQVGTAISEIDSVTQNVAASAEEAAAAAEELSAQSEMMRCSVSNLLEMVGAAEGQANRGHGTSTRPAMLPSRMKRPALPAAKSSAQRRSSPEIIPFDDEA
jgi:methyl-accepting chemotaxis protein